MLSNSTTDANIKEGEAIIFSIFIIIFLLSVFLNSILLYLVMKKNYFKFDQQSIHYLFQMLIVCDLLISILILPDILVKKTVTNGKYHPAVILFRAMRDALISIQIFLLVAIAIDGLVSILNPINSRQFWNLSNIKRIFITYLSVIVVLLLVKSILLLSNLDSNVKQNINYAIKFGLSLIGMIFIVMIIIIYSYLFCLIYRRQMDRCDKSMKRKQCLKSQSTETEENFSEDESGRNKITVKQWNFGKRIIHMKFVKVLFWVNLLMIVSFLPGCLYNSGLLKFKAYNWFIYLFYVHSLGDAIIFLFIRLDLRKDLTKLLRLG
uniref:GCR158 n=1 Tax=Schmidtea mediterranea TaxID=79327 RepID=A0A193KUF9_SCHMD|nr:GCR158 [Schmidtea mediterranea]